ncbi:unnamed protein product, partial [Rhizoctonia solani]
RGRELTSTSSPHIVHTCFPGGSVCNTLRKSIVTKRASPKVPKKCFDARRISFCSRITAGIGIKSMFIGITLEHFEDGIDCLMGIDCWPTLHICGKNVKSIFDVLHRLVLHSWPFIPDVLLCRWSP